MQGRKHQVPRQGGSQPYLRRLVVTDLAYQNDVWVLPQARSQHDRERQIDLIVDLHLVDASQAVFDRILDGDDLLLRRVDFRQRGIKGGCLTAASRAGYENHAVGSLNELAIALEHVRRHSEIVEREQAGLAVE